MGTLAEHNAEWRGSKAFFERGVARTQRTQEVRDKLTELRRLSELAKTDSGDQTARANLKQAVFDGIGMLNAGRRYLEFATGCTALCDALKVAVQEFGFPDLTVPNVIKSAELAPENDGEVPYPQYRIE